MLRAASVHLPGNWASLPEDIILALPVSMGLLIMPLLVGI